MCADTSTKHANVHTRVHFGFDFNDFALNGRKTFYPTSILELIGMVFVTYFLVQNSNFSAQNSNYDKIWVTNK